MGAELIASALKGAAGDEAAKRDAFDQVYELNRVLRALRLKDGRRGTGYDTA